MSRKQTQKNRTLTNSSFELTNAFEMVKKTCQSLESLNYDVRARISAHITILCQDEQDLGENADFNELSF